MRYRSRGRVGRSFSRRRPKRRSRMISYQPMRQRLGRRF